MRKLPVIVLLVLLVLLLASCGELVTPVAYVRFELSGAQNKVVYSSSAGATSEGHIGVYENEKELLSINYFPRCMGTDDIDDVRYILMDLSKNYRELHVNVLDKDYYSGSKSLYLNGVALTPSKVNVLESIVVIEYEALPLLRTNPQGHMDYDALNVLEYK